ncbi:ras-related protein Rab-22A isoform X4 [Hirundo rustica]|uniref:ras-related protein Rab-22A isoform X4 n=1 Tax=Hirundo rustica TaxID=43150 RepID=UPI001A93B28C|nr:ras-related protein Rab-22A isoform X4 [Hirundo rustica]
MCHTCVISCAPLALHPGKPYSIAVYFTKSGLFPLLFHCKERLHSFVKKPQSLSNNKDTGVGKSSIVWRFVEDSFDPNINPTIGASFMTKTVQYQNELHKFLIWDTAGQERFRALAPMYYRGSAAAIIVYDITKEETFSTLKNWVKELRQHGPPNIVVAIAGNKCDLNDVRSQNSIH